MANVKLSELPAAGATPAAADRLVAVQIAGPTDKTYTVTNLFTSPGVTTAINPITSDAAALGTTSLMWSDLFLASGAVVNFNNGDVTLTHSAGILTLGASMDLRLTTAGTNAASVVTVDGTQTLTNKTLTSPTLTTPVLGTPSSGTVTNLTGTASININGTVGATTPAAGLFTTVGGTGVFTALSGTAIPAGGTAGSGYTFSSTANFGLFFGSGAPTLTAARGSLYLRSDGTPYYNTDGSTTWTAVGAGGGGSGTVTVVSSGSLTSTALMTGGGTTECQTPSATATLDSSGNISTPGSLSVGSGASTAGALVVTQGTTQSTGTTNITIQAPAAVTSYIRTLPGAVGSSGFLLETVSGSVQTESLVAFTGTGNVVRDTSPTIDSPTLTTPAAFTTGGAITLAENTSIALDPAGSADGKYTGITVTGTGGATIAFGDLVTLDKDDSRWELVDVSVAAAATGDARGLIGIAVTSSTDGTAITVLLSGIIRADANFPTLTIGAAVYASTTGDVVVTQPSTTDHVIRIVGYGLTADEMAFQPDGSWITHT